MTPPITPPESTQSEEELTEAEMERMRMALLDVHLATDEPQQVFVDLKRCLSYIRSLQALLHAAEERYKADISLMPSIINDMRPEEREIAMTQYLTFAERLKAAEEKVEALQDELDGAEVTMDAIQANYKAVEEELEIWKNASAKLGGENFDMAKKLKAAEERIKVLEKPLDRLVFLHMCEQEGLSPPTFKQWLDAVDDAAKALHPSSPDAL